MKKKTFLLLLFKLATILVFAQSSAVTNAVLYLHDGKLDKAKIHIDKAIIHEQTRNKAKTWFYKDIIYMEIYNSYKPEYKGLIDYPGKIAYIAFKKSIDLDIPGGEYARKSEKSLNEIRELEEKKIRIFDNIILNEQNLGKLSLENNIAPLLNELKSIFPNYTINKNIGQQDGPDFIYYEILHNNNEVFSIHLDSEDPTKIDKVIINNANIIDVYGLKVGSSYYDVKKVRPNIKHYTYHFHTYLYSSNSHIRYEIQGYQEGWDKKKYSKEEIKDWRIINIIWQIRISSE